MSGLLAGVTLASMFAALVVVIICIKYHRIRKWYRGQAWLQSNGPGRHEEEGHGQNSNAIVISSPQLAELSALSHSPLSPVTYVVPPPPFLLHTPPLPTPPLPMQPAPAVLPPVQELPSRPNVLRKPLPRPMLPSPPPPPSPIPSHRSHLVPRPLRIGPSRMSDSLSPQPVLPTASSRVNKDDGNIQTKQQQQQQLKKQDSSKDDNSTDNSLSISSTLRNSNATDSTDSDTTLPESPRVMTARTQTVQWVPMQPHGQSPFTKILLLSTIPPQPEEPTRAATAVSTISVTAGQVAK